MALYKNMWPQIKGYMCLSCLCNFRAFCRLKSTYSRYKIHLPVQDSIHKTSTHITLSTYCNVSYIIQRNSLHLSHSQSVNDNKKGTTSSETKEPKKPKESKTFITLLGTDKSMYVTTVEDATKLADRRNYKLVKVKDFDTKSGRAVYQLMTDSDFLKFNEDEVDSKSPKDKAQAGKGEKAVSIKSSISENDTKTKVKMMKKWLSKKLQVNIIVTGDSSSAENVCNIIEKEIGSDGKIMKKKKGGGIRLTITPPKNAVETKAS